MSEALLIIVASLFSIYFVSSCIEASLAFIFVRHTPSPDEPATNKILFAPMWEIADLLLLLGLSTLLVFFNNSLRSIVHAERTILMVSIVALILRAVSSLLNHYHPGFLKPSRLLGLIFLLASLTVPISFGFCGIYLLTGHQFWVTSVGRMLALTLVLNVFSFLFLWSLNLSPSKASKIISIGTYVLPALLCLVGGIGIQLTIRNSAPHLRSWTYDLFIMSWAFVILVQVAAWLLHIRWMVGVYIGVVSLAGPLLLTLANRPYLLFPSEIITNAYNNAALGRTTLIGILLLLPICILGIAALIWSRSKPLKPL